MENRSVIVIAEAGVNHNGDINLARKLVDAAEVSGVDYVKFQTFSANSIATSFAPKAQYQIISTGGETQLEMLRSLELTRDMHYELYEYCKGKKVDFLSTAFDIQNSNFLKTFNLNLIKIPSGEITNLPYLRNIGSMGQSILLSTGMSNYADIEAALRVLEDAGASHEKIILLHCTSEYPAPIESVNLLAIETLRKTFGVPVGYSDHTVGIEISLAAVAMGAVVIEKHITLDKTLPGPDHRSSIEPPELNEMVRSIRNIEIALGDGVKKPSHREEVNKLAIRKSIVASRDIEIGDEFNEQNLDVKRPGNGISPMLWDSMIGRKSDRKYFKDELIEW